MTILKKKVALAAGAGVLSIGLLGGAALAAFAPVGAAPSSEVEAQLGTAAANEVKGDRLKAILDALVAKGVITQAQADAVLVAIRDAEPSTRPAEVLKRIYGNLLEQSAEYLGMSMADLKTKLPGKSLGDIANATPGKSRDGLVAALLRSVNAAIDKALAESKITKEQADKATSEAPGHIARFVDHKYEQRPATTRGVKVGAFLANALAVAKDYLGVDMSAALREGKSLGEIANATPGKSRDGLIAALTTAANTQIDKAQADGKVTAEQAAQLKSQVGAAVTALVDRKAARKPGR